jgi:hypothetical protein
LTAHDGVRCAASEAVDLDGLLTVLEQEGLLLLSDGALPSVTSLVIGSPIHGSWWGHPLGNDIFRLVNALADQPNVLLMKLLSRKVTFVHRRLWPAVVAVGEARERWQMDGLDEPSRKLLDLLDDEGQLAWDDVPPLFLPDGRAFTRAVSDLEQRLLVHSTEVHTPSGAHARNIQTWRTWAAGTGPLPALPSVSQAKHQLETTLHELNERYAGSKRLPWQTRRST